MTTSAPLAAPAPWAGGPDGPGPAPIPSAEEVREQHEKNNSHSGFFACCPIATVLLIALMYHVVFVSQHCLPMVLQPGIKVPSVPLRWLGMLQMCGFYLIQSMFLFSYFRVMYTSPGTGPTTPEWTWDLGGEGTLTERKQSDGERRFCRWCAKYKPDRTHHCRKCHSCILKMDHHCPWIGTCVGYKNHKFFLLSIFYAMLAVDYCTLVHFIDYQEDIFGEHLMAALFLDSSWILLSVLLTSFCALHVFLVLRNETTLEFRERRTWTRDGRSPYDLGYYGNLCSVLGESHWLWFVPISTHVGNGISWPRSTTCVEEAALLSASGLSAATSTSGAKLGAAKPGSNWGMHAV